MLHHLFDMVRKLTARVSAVTGRAVRELDASVKVFARAYKELAEYITEDHWHYIGCPESVTGKENESIPHPIK